MKIYGYWGELDAPVIMAEVVYERLNIKKFVRFIVDTGSSKTILIERDLKRMGIEYSHLQKSDKPSIGIGGAVETYFIPSVKLIFSTDVGTYTEKLKNIYVLRHEPKNKKDEERIKRIPSLLGRDVLDKYTLVVNKKRGLVVITDEEVRVR